MDYTEGNNMDPRQIDELLRSVQAAQDRNDYIYSLAKQFSANYMAEAQCNLYHNELAVKVSYMLKDWPDELTFEQFQEYTYRLMSSESFLEYAIGLHDQIAEIDCDATF